MPRSGRPPSLDAVIRQRTRPDGTVEDVTASQEVLERIRVGAPHHVAAASAGLARNTLLNWRRAGAAAAARALKPGTRLTTNEKRYIDFLSALEKAEADAHISRLAVLEGAMRGGYVTETVTEEWEPDPTVPAGPNGAPAVRLVSRKVVRKTEPPQWTPAAWWLERRLPGEYARRVEVSGPGGSPVTVEERARSLSEALSVFQLAEEADKAVAVDAEVVPEV